MDISPGYGTNGWIAVAIAVFGLFWLYAAKSASVAGVVDARGNRT